MATLLSAIVFGSTGAVGKEVVSQLSNSPCWGKVVACTRRQVEKSVWSSSNEEKIHVQILDYSNIKESLGAIDVSEYSSVFYCLGSTRRDAGSAENFVRIDQGYLKEIAPLCKESGVRHFSLVSSAGASSSSFFLYMKTKGQNEDFVKGLGFPLVSIWQPGLLGRGADARQMEKIFGWLTREIPVAAVAKAMIADAEKKLSDSGAKSLSVYKNPEIYALAGSS